jgi:hypothetical protein
MNSKAKLPFHKAVPAYAALLKDPHTTEIGLGLSTFNYRVSDNGFGKARERNPSKACILVRRRGFRPITQSKIFIWKPIVNLFMIRDTREST